MAEPAQKNSNSSRDARAQQAAFARCFQWFFVRWCGSLKDSFPCWPPSLTRDFLVFVAQVSSLPVRMAVYCGMSAVIVFFFWTAVKWGPTAAGIL